MKPGKRDQLCVFLTLVVLGGVCAAGCSGVQYTDINSAVLASSNVERRLEKINGRYKLGAADSIQVLMRNEQIVSAQQGIQGAQVIRPDGYITLELIGDVYVEGMTPMEVADVLTKAFQMYIRDVEVIVRVTGFFSKRYYVFGEVPSVGEKPFDGDVTVLSAFGRAGGVTTRAAWDRIRLVRATTTTRQIFKINLSDIVKDGRWDTNVQLKANDVLYVPPTYLARVGYFIDNLLFPFRSLFSAMWMFNTQGGTQTR